MTPELNSKIAIWRAKSVEGKLTPEELREAIAALRQGRVGASIASAASKRSKAVAVIPDANSMLDDMS